MLPLQPPSLIIATPATYPAGYNVLPVEDALDTMQISVQVPKNKLVVVVVTVVGYDEETNPPKEEKIFLESELFRWRSTPSLTWTKGIRCSPQIVFTRFSHENGFCIDGTWEIIIMKFESKYLIRLSPQVK